MALGLGVSLAITLKASTPSAYFVKNLTFVFLGRYISTEDSCENEQSKRDDDSRWHLAIVLVEAAPVKQVVDP